MWLLLLYWLFHAVSCSISPFQFILYMLSSRKMNALYNFSYIFNIIFCVSYLQRCYEGGREVIVVPKTSASTDNPWFGLAKYAWSGYVNAHAQTHTYTHLFIFFHPAISCGLPTVLSAMCWSVLAVVWSTAADSTGWETRTPRVALYDLRSNMSGRGWVLHSSSLSPVSNFSTE